MQLRQGDQSIQSATHLFVEETSRMKMVSASDAMFSGNLGEVILGRLSH